MKTSALFNDKSELYEVSRPAYPEALFEYLSTVSPSTESVWDCACGNGQAAVGLARYFDSVKATDISEQQIENAKVHPRVDYTVSVSENTEFSKDTFDLVCVAQALHWFDLDIFWPEVKRVLKPDGVFAAWGYTWPRISPSIDRVFQEVVLDKIEPYWAPQNKLLWDKYKAVNFPFSRLSPPDIDMKVEWTKEEFIDFVGTFSATRRCIEVAGNGFLKEANEKLGRLWGNGKLVVDLDFVLYVGRAET